MKTINSIASIQVDVPAKGSVTIVATYEDRAFGQPSQRHTVGEFCEGHKKWYRGHRVTDCAFFVFRNGAKSVAILQRALSKLAVYMENSLTWAPIFTKQPVGQVIALGASATLIVEASVEFPNDFPATYQWFVTADGKENSQLNDGGIYAGVKTQSLVVTPAEKSNFIYFCAATNASGSTNSNGARITVN